MRYAHRNKRHYRLLSMNFIYTFIFSVFLLSETVSFVIFTPSSPRSHRFLSSSLKATSNEQEVERYRNRAALTESVLKEKMHEMKILKGKLEILQVVVKKLQQNSTAIQQPADNTTITTEKWRAEETKRIQAELEIKQLQSQLNQTKFELDRQASQHEEAIKEFKQQNVDDRRQEEQQLRKAREKEQLLENKIRALQKEVLDIDQSLETTQGELMNVQKRLALREDELRQLSSEQERKNKLLKEQLKAALRKKDELQRKVDEQTANEHERQESIEIASAAVRAAEMREASLRQQVESLHRQLESQQAKKDDERVQELLHELDLERIKASKDRERYRKEYDAKLEAQRETYEAELRLFRGGRTSPNVIESVASDSSGTNDLTQAVQANQKNEITTGETSNAGSRDEAPKKKARRGVWGRLRSLLTVRRKG